MRLPVGSRCGLSVRRDRASIPENDAGTRSDSTSQLLRFVELDYMLVHA